MNRTKATTVSARPHGVIDFIPNTDFMNHWIKPSIYREVGDIMPTLSGLNASTQSILLAQAKGVLLNASNEKVRVSAAKIVIALFPTSLGTIRWLTHNNRGPNAEEVHFSLFCFMDDLLESRSDKKSLGLIPPIVSEYIARAKSDDAFAVWMASELLGNLWEVKAGTRWLKIALANSKYSVGFEMSLDGLQKAANRMSLSSRRRLLRFLKNQIDHISSRVKRTSIEYVIGKIEDIREP